LSAFAKWFALNNNASETPAVPATSGRRIRCREYEP
jgi:hypothetical protein